MDDGLNIKNELIKEHKEETVDIYMILGMGKAFLSIQSKKIIKKYS